MAVMDVTAILMCCYAQLVCKLKYQHLYQLGGNYEQNKKRKTGRFFGGYEYGI